MSLARWIVAVVAPVPLFGLPLLLGAGRWDWWQAWVFLGAVTIASSASLVSLRHHPDLLRERFKPPLQRGQPLADKVVLLAFIALFFGLIAFIGADVFRLQLLPTPAPLVAWAGLVLFSAAWAVMTWAMTANAFAAPVVRHQRERQQRVVDTGPYRVVRHPMYAGAALLLIGMPLWLGSTAGALLAALPIGLLAFRIRIEERFLARELSGYEAYARRVRYRLVPFVW